MLALFFSFSSLIFSDVQIQISPFFDDDDEFYDEDGPIIWIGPGIYYGVWFDNEFEYRQWCRRRYYNRYYYYDDWHHRRYWRDGDHHHHGGGGSHHH